MRRDSPARIRYFNTGAELDAVERVTTTTSHLLDVPDSIRPTPSAWTAAIVLTVQEAAGVVKLTQWAIYRAIKRGDSSRISPGGRLRIDEVDLQVWLDATRVSPSAPAVRRPGPPVIPPPARAGSSRRASTDGTLRARVRATRRKHSAA